MIKTNPALKKNITTDDKINMIETICSYIIGVNEDGEDFYMPYGKDSGFSVAVTRYLIEGIKFEEGDSVFKTATTDKDVCALIEAYRNSNTGDVNYIMSMVDDIVDYRKQKQIYENTALYKKLLENADVEREFELLRVKIAENQNKVLEQQIKANEYEENVMRQMTPEETAELNRMVLENGFNTDKLVDAVVKKYLKSGFRKTKKAEIIDAKNEALRKKDEKIRELEEYKRSHEARNVPAGN